MLTPAERRGAVLVLLLFVLGTGWDLWRAAHPRLARLGADPAVAGAGRGPGGAAGLPAEPGAAVSPTTRFAGDARSSASVDAAPLAAPLDINRADLADLDRLPGIGPVLARRILERRRDRGKFQAVEDLLAVPGIGPRLFARLRTRVRV